MSIDREGWQTGMIPCAGWYVLEPWGEPSVWLDPVIDDEGYHVVWSDTREDDDPESLALADEGMTIDQVRWRHDTSRMSPTQAATVLDALRAVPGDGEWGVLDSHWLDGERHWDGCRPIDWRPTKEQAIDLAHELGAHFVGQVVRRGRHGWSIGVVHEITAGWMTLEEIAARWVDLRPRRVDMIASQLGIFGCARHCRFGIDAGSPAYRLSPDAVALVERELRSRGFRRAG